jgi:hypothetical protein
VLDELRFASGLRKLPDHHDELAGIAGFGSRSAPAAIEQCFGRLNPHLGGNFWRSSYAGQRADRKLGVGARQAAHINQRFY